MKKISENKMSRAWFLHGYHQKIYAFRWKLPSNSTKVTELAEYHLQQMGILEPCKKLWMLLKTFQQQITMWNTISWLLTIVRSIQCIPG